MTEFPTKYDIHGFLSIRSNTELPIPAYFVTDSVSSDLELRVEEYESLVPDFDEAQSRRLGTHRYTFNEGALTVRYPGPKPIEVQLSGLEQEKTVIRFTPGFRDSGSFENLFEATLMLKLLQANVAVVHGAGLVRDDTAILLSSMGRMGKTSTALQLIRDHDFEFMGDNILLLDEDGTVFAWPDTIGIFPGTVGAEQFLPDDSRWRVVFKRMLGRSDIASAVLFHKFGVDLSENIPPTSLGVDVCNQALATDIYILSGGVSEEGRYSIAPDRAVLKLETGADMELSIDDYYIQLYSFLSDSAIPHPTQSYKRRSGLLKSAISSVNVSVIATNRIDAYPAFVMEDQADG